MNRTVVALGVAAALAMSACGNKGDSNITLKPGSYAGSTADKQPITVDVGTGGLRVDGHSTRRAPQGIYIEEKRPNRRLKCRPGTGTDLICDVTTNSRTDTVELMKL